jgi:hypothetical protein
LNKGIHHNRLLQRAWSKYGSASFVFSIVEVVEVLHDLDAKERSHIAEKRPFFNGISVFGESHHLQHSPNTRRRLRESNLNRWRIRRENHDMNHSEETKNKIRQAALGRTVSTETRAKMSESAKRRSPPELSPEARQRVAEKQRGKIVSAETRQRLSESHQGKPWSEERRRKHALKYGKSAAN